MQSDPNLEVRNTFGADPEVKGVVVVKTETINPATQKTVWTDYSQTTPKAIVAGFRDSN